MSEITYKQVAPIEEQETTIVIDYELRSFRIWTNRATVMNRITKQGYKPIKVDWLGDEVYGLTFQFPTKDIGQFMRTGIFKYA